MSKIFSIFICVILSILTVATIINIFSREYPPEFNCYFLDNKTFVVIKAGNKELKNVSIYTGTRLLCKIDKVYPYTQRICNAENVPIKDMDRVIYAVYDNKVTYVLCLGER